MADQSANERAPAAPPDSATAGGYGGSGGEEQRAATLASAHLPRAVEVVREILEDPGRNAMAQLGAARLIFELSAKLQVASATTATKLYVIDSAKAAEELRKRLEGKK